MCVTDNTCAVVTTAWQRHLAPQSLQLLLGTGVVTLTGRLNGGQQQLGVTEQSVCALQVSPQFLLHIKVSVTHLRPQTERHTIQMSYYTFRFD